MHLSELSGEGELVCGASCMMRSFLNVTVCTQLWSFTSQASSPVQELTKYGKMDRIAVQLLPKCNRPVVSLQLMLFYSFRVIL